MTNQLRSLLQPLDTTGAVKHDMISAMGALRRGAEALLPQFAVFVSEPIAEWLEVGLTYKAGDARRQQHSVAADQTQHEWYPRKKVHFTKLKLLGHNPAAVMCDEMRETSYRINRQPYFAQICEVIRGPSNSRRRALDTGAPLSVADQVDVLIEQSCDANILGRVFVGWGPFC